MLWHRYWDCPLLAESTLQEVRDTQDLKCWVEGPVLYHQQCLWGRAILPAGITQGGVAEEHKVHDWQSPGYENLLDITRHVYPDGSGGPRWAPECCPRAGAGAASMLVTQVGAEADQIRIERVELQGGGVCGLARSPPHGRSKVVCQVKGTLAGLSCALRGGQAGRGPAS